MIVDVEIPNQGLTITEATLVQWCKQPGEAVAEGEVLFLFETDKAAVEVEAPRAGTVLEHLAEEGDVVPLGRIVAKIGTEASDSANSKRVGNGSPNGNGAAPMAQSAPVESVDDPLGDAAGIDGAAAPSLPSGRPIANAANGSSAQRSSAAFGKRIISPRARRAAEQFNIDLALVGPTGGRGTRIRERDVLAVADQHATSAPVSAPAPAAAKPEISILPKTHVVPAAPPQQEPAQGTGATLSRLRRITAERTTASFRDVPHFYLTAEVRVDSLMEFRKMLIAEMEGMGAPRVTVTDFFVKALGLALRDVPALNAQWHNGALTPLSSTDIGLAVDTPDGLTVTVLRGADTASISRLAAQRVQLVERARIGRSLPDDLAGGSVTLSNLGASGVDQFQAIINAPQSAILAVGAIKQRPLVVDGKLEVCQTAILTLSADHRVVDGAEAARFLERVAAYLERPLLLCAA